MSADYELGTIAVATVRGVPNVRVMRLEGSGWVSGEPVAGTKIHRDEPTDVRPLVVLDPEDREACRKFADRIAPNVVGNTNAVQAALRDMVRPPKPPEPQGLGAVVEDAWEVLYVRTEPDPQDPDDTAVWTTADGRFFSWGQVDPVRVLSDGWEPKP